uniref:Uncharacterized protein n=1 Tax=Cacopsylla melanoneura TaxID=428564 RepID=A0A8D8XSH2_9HEMI
MVHFLQQCLRMVCPLCQVLPINHKAQVLLVTQCSLWFQVNKDPPLLQQDSLLNLPKQTPSLNPPFSQLLYHTTTNLRPLVVTHSPLVTMQTPSLLCSLPSPPINLHPLVVTIQYRHLSIQTPP